MNTTTTAPARATTPAMPAARFADVRCPACTSTVPLLVEGSDLCLRCDSLHYGARS